MTPTVYIITGSHNQTNSSLEIIFGDLPVKMTSTNVPVMKQNVPVIVPDCQKHRIQNMQWLKSSNT
jgi:hypothetical protein